VASIHGAAAAARSNALQPQRWRSVPFQGGAWPRRIGRLAVVRAPPFGIDPYVHPVSLVDQAGGAAGQYGGSAHQRLQARTALQETVEVGDHLNRGTRVRAERRAPTRQLLHLVIPTWQLPPP
jgi:hypothetical protein